MFKKLEKVTKRRNTTPVKILFRIEVNNVTIKNASNLEGKVYVSCCFERGNKIVSTNDELCRVEMNGNAEVYFDQTLSLVATMYQDHDGKYLEKFGKFIFRLKTKSGSYKGLGVYDLPLHSYATRYQPVDEILSLTKISASSIMAHITITPKILDQTADDSASNYSGCTDHTTGAADFSCHMSDAGSDIGDEDDDMMDRSVGRARSESTGLEAGSPEISDILTKSKSVPIMSSTTSTKKRTSPIPQSTTSTAGNYSNLKSLTPIMSSDSLDETISPLEHESGDSPNTKSRKKAPTPTKSSEVEKTEETHFLDHDSENDDLHIRESESAEETNILGKKKLLKNQESSDTLLSTEPTTVKKKSKGFLCCFSPESTTNAVVRRDDTSRAQPNPRSTTSSNQRPPHSELSGVGKKPNKPQDAKALDTKSLDTSLGKSSSSHGKKSSTTTKKPKSSSSSHGGMSSGSQHGGSQHGPTKKRNPNPEEVSKPTWLN